MESPARSDLQLVQIRPCAAAVDLVPSRFNSRTTTPDGTLVVYNSFSGALTGFPASLASTVQRRLRQIGVKGIEDEITEYLHERGYLVQRGTNELDRFRILFGTQQYQTDQLELILMSSEECNFRCVYCYETFPRGTMEPWVRDSVIKLLESRAHRLNSFRPSYFGGEPLLGLEAIQQMAPAFVDICDRHGIHLSSTMTTNGYLLTPEVFKQLLAWRITTFQITIDGTPEDHNKQRILKGGGDTFEQISRNVLSAAAVPGNFKIIVRMNFTEQNGTNLHSFLDCFAPLRGDSRFLFRFYPVGKWGGPNDGDLEVCGMHGEEQRRRLTITASELGYNAESRLPYIRARDGMNVCYAARPYSFIIGADGKIMKCTVALDTKDYNIVGHLTKDGRAEIDLDKLARWVKPYFEEDAVCRKCFYVPVCQGFSCPLPRIESNERPCPPEKEQIQQTLRSIWSIKNQSGRREQIAVAASLSE